MRGSRPHLIAVLCVLLLNLQLFAGNALGCVHAADASAPLGCPHMAAMAGLDLDASGQTRATDTSDTDTPCQKCNLSVVAAGWHLVATALPLLALPHPDLPAASLTIRPEAPSPDGLLRPPRLDSV